MWLQQKYSTSYSVNDHELTVPQGRTAGRVSPQGRFFGLTIHLPQKPDLHQELFEERTRTVICTVGATATVAQFRSCIGSSQFVTAAGVTSTAPCSRRRRSAEMIDLLLEVTPVLS